MGFLKQERLKKVFNPQDGILLPTGLFDEDYNNDNPVTSVMHLADNVVHLSDNVVN